MGGIPLKVTLEVTVPDDMSTADGVFTALAMAAEGLDPVMGAHGASGTAKVSAIVSADKLTGNERSTFVKQWIHGEPAGTGGGHRVPDSLD
jgi:hypothetical protein